MTKLKQIFLLLAYAVVAMVALAVIHRMAPESDYVWLALVILPWGGVWLALYTRMLREQAASDDFCRRLGCKALPIHMSSGIRLVFDTPSWGGCIVLKGLGSFAGSALRRVCVTMAVLTRSACPPILLHSRKGDWAQQLAMASFPTGVVSLGESPFQDVFQARADSATIAETAFPPRVRALVGKIADVAGMMPPPDVTHALVDMFVEMLEDEDDKRAKGPRSSHEFSVQRWGTSFSVTLRAPNRRFSTDPSILSQIPQLVAIASAIVAATGPLQREVDNDVCRACADPRLPSGSLVCKRCGARYHRVCDSVASESGVCPVWRCGGTTEQLAAICDRNAPAGILDVLRRY